MRLSTFVAFPVAAFCLSGCNTTDISSARLPYESGQFAFAADEISTIHPQTEDGASSKNAARDNIWLLIEKGKMLLDAGRFEESNVAFYEANRILEALDEEATVSLGGIRSGAASLLLDDCQADYIGSSYDRILLPAYVAVNHLMLGEPEAAAIAARQQQTWQARAEEARAKEVERLEELDEEAQSEGLGFDHNGAIAEIESRFWERDGDEDDLESPGQVVSRLTTTAEGIARPALNSYSIPFGQIVGSIALAADGKALEANSMLSDLQQQVPCPPLSTALMQPRTAYVVFENGLAPKRTDETLRFVYVYKAMVDVLDKDGNPTGAKKEVTVPSLVVLPFAGLEDGVTWSKNMDGAIELVENVEASALQIAVGGATRTTAMLHDLDGVVGLEFKEALPGIVARIIFRAVIQEAGQIAANNEFGMLAVIGGALAKSTIDPDLRGWESLGSSHQYAAVAVPDDGVLKFATIHDGEVVASQEVSVPVGPPVFVYARSTNASNLIVHSCPLISN